MSSLLESAAKAMQSSILEKYELALAFGGR